MINREQSHLLDWTIKKIHFFPGWRCKPWLRSGVRRHWNVQVSGCQPRLWKLDAISNLHYNIFQIKIYVMRSYKIDVVLNCWFLVSFVSCYMWLSIFASDASQAEILSCSLLVGSGITRLRFMLQRPFWRDRADMVPVEKMHWRWRLSWSSISEVTHGDSQRTGAL